MKTEETIVKALREEGKKHTKTYFLGMHIGVNPVPIIRLFIPP